MKTLIWILTAVLALLWTALGFGTVQLLHWAADAMAGGGAGGWEPGAISLRIPPWLEPWIDMGWLLAAMDAAAQLVIWVQAVWPHAGQAVPHIVSAVWMVWALGLLLLLALAGGLHWVIRSTEPRPASTEPGRQIL
jgi:hypothetical protein